MRIKVLLFGIIADICGKAEIEINDVNSTDTLIEKMIENTLKTSMLI